MRKLFAMWSLVLIMLGMGCVAASHFLTYSRIDSDAVEYAVDAGVADVNDYDSWWTNLVMVEQLEGDVDAGHKKIQQRLKHLLQKDDLEYSIHKDTVASDKADGLQREETFFGETGLLPLGLSMAGFGGLTGLIGLMRKRAGDVTPQEMEHALAEATDRTTAELSAKEKQFIQVVKGLQVFMDEYKDTSDNKEAAILKGLKIALNGKQDDDTKAAVAVVKKTS